MLYPLLISLVWYTCCVVDIVLKQAQVESPARKCLESSLLCQQEDMVNMWATKQLFHSNCSDNSQQLILSTTLLMCYKFFKINQYDMNLQKGIYFKWSYSMWMRWIFLEEEIKTDWNFLKVWLQFSAVCIPHSDQMIVGTAAEGWMLRYQDDC